MRSTGCHLALNHLALCRLADREEIPIPGPDQTHDKYGSFATKRDVVLKTWSETLKNEYALPDDWINTPEVLVGTEICEGTDRKATGLRDC